MSLDNANSTNERGPQEGVWTSIQGPNIEERVVEKEDRVGEGLVYTTTVATEFVERV